LTRTDRFRIRITRTGWLFILLCLGIGIAGLNTGNNLLYLIFSMMLSFLILSGLLSNSTLQCLEIHPDFPERIFARQEVPVRITLENRKRRFPSFALALGTDHERVERREHAFIVKIPPGRTETTTDYILFSKRGRTHLPPYFVETAYPFGLIRKYAGVPSAGETVVYPQVLEVDRFFAADRRLHGEFLAGQSGGASNPYGIRDFVPGDPARIIHWKTTARSGDLKVKEFEREKRLRVLLDLRLARAAGSNPERREKAVSAAASLLLLLSKRQFEVGLRINGERIEPRGRGFIDTYLTALALAQPPVAEKVAAAEAADALVVVTDRSGERTDGPAMLFVGPRELEAL
jgi:uncharacterized protein (DUF58 family)